MNAFRKIKKLFGKVRFAFYNIYLQQIEFNDFLLINGKILKIDSRTDECRKVISITLKSKMEASNKTKGSISFINPKYLVQPKIKHFSMDEKGFYVFTTDYYSLPNFEYNSTQKKIEKSDFENISVDERKNIIINLTSGEKYLWDDEIFFEFELSEKKRDWQGFGWNQIKSKTNCLWLKFEYHLPEKPNHIKSKLAETRDELWTNLKDIPAAQFYVEDYKTSQEKLVSQPIFFDLSKVEIENKK